MEAKVVYQDSSKSLNRLRAHRVRHKSLRTGTGDVEYKIFKLSGLKIHMHVAFNFTLYQ